MTVVLKLVRYLAVDGVNRGADLEIWWKNQRVVRGIAWKNRESTHRLPQFDNVLEVWSVFKKIKIVKTGSTLVMLL